LLEHSLPHLPLFIITLLDLDRVLFTLLFCNHAQLLHFFSCFLNLLLLLFQQALVAELVAEFELLLRLLKVLHLRHVFVLRIQQPLCIFHVVLLKCPLHLLLQILLLEFAEPSLVSDFEDYNVFLLSNGFI
jgi:hypothetical protein